MRQVTRRASLSILAGSALLSAASIGSGPASANEYPARPLRMIVPLGVGGTSDTIARAVAEKVSVALGQKIIVDNQPGGGSIRGTMVAKQAAPDGYTLLFGGSFNLASNVTLIPDLPYDPVKDFEPISRMFDVSLMLVVHPSLPAKTLQEFVALVKQKPGQLNYASIGNGSTSHLTMELLKKTAGIEISHVPYRGASQAMTDLLSGHVQAMMEPIASAGQHVREGRLKGLGFSGNKRSPIMPELPLISETYPGFYSSAWGAVLVPAGTPKAVVMKLNRAFVEVLSSPEMRDYISKLGAEAVSSSPEALSAYIKSEIPKWGDIIQHSGAKLDD
ncbi:Bug family tripartite tricarboxylate transporter substrate binding protein [Vineibacter terrae]|nr:tripartite tricarboxylate transporter substrate binding protein [Vineibacter terrae]